MDSEANVTPDDSRLVLVSNRLPITIKLDPETNEYTFKPSSGGLVSGLAGLLKTKKFAWYGWAGLEVPEEQMQPISDRLKDEHSAYPVWISNDLADKHYNGFSNEVLWPLLHYHPGEATFDDSVYLAYQNVNHLFAERLIQELRDGDLIWIHDYHLMLLPLFLRHLINIKGVNVKIGWFVHTPWPSSEVFRVLPCREDLLEGVLASDLVGFHTFDYAKHFLSCCGRLLGASCTPTSVIYEGHKTGVGAFPIGIDPEKFAEGLQAQVTQDKIVHYRDRFRDAKLIIGCDRLDYIKGVPHKLHAFQYLLESHPELVGKVQLVQIAIPSREDVDEYQSLKKAINELAGAINGQFGTLDFNPVHLKHTTVTHQDLMALFSVSDICFVTSTRDGMNLVSYEYVACQAHRHGTLVLSEFAGCAQSFANGAIICNPWDVEESADSLYEAIMLTDEDRQNRHDHLWEYVHKYTSAWWGETFVQTLSETNQIMPSDDNDTESEQDFSRQIVKEAVDAELNRGKTKPTAKTVTFEEPKVEQARL
ncbi:alpha,alpha-trehalose-phosphate synthase [Sphaceloma murrayae]|uniref:Alpha,alpha-trehalose-phosphate synthase n=1 Tax=Sphaceloma murrayae TaxID=2082308 RepID=A0A2K1QMC8_9PEZI|nr:alpha,alpha-trehalose-phosphate synthase [Sphaceloma murrayae]